MKRKEVGKREVGDQRERERKGIKPDIGKALE